MALLARCDPGRTESRERFRRCRNLCWEFETFLQIKVEMREILKTNTVQNDFLLLNVNCGNF